MQELGSRIDRAHRLLSSIIEYRKRQYELVELYLSTTQEAATSRDLEERDGKFEQLRSELTQLKETQKLLYRIFKETTLRRKHWHGHEDW